MHRAMSLLSLGEVDNGLTWAVPMRCGRRRMDWGWYPDGAVMVRARIGVSSTQLKLHDHPISRRIDSGVHNRSAKTACTNSLSSRPQDQLDDKLTTVSGEESSESLKLALKDLPIG